MGIEELATWYQKKIGTYDKQQWEKTVEQKILNGYYKIIVHRKITKPKTEFIDLDLIRGSSFPKAKPQHGLCVVTRLALQRYFLLPFYRRWWIRQTSSNIFKIFFVLYTLQLTKIILYLWHWNDPVKKTENYHAPSPESEIIIPMLMMFIMTLIHCLIVSTNCGTEKLSPHTRTKRIKRRRVFNQNGNRTDLKRMSSDDAVVRGKPTELFTKKKGDITYIRRVKENITTKTCKRASDEGFESFNGNGSSENGDESKLKIGECIFDLKEINVITPPVLKRPQCEDEQQDEKEMSNCIRKCSSDEHESDTESEPETLIRKRTVGPKVSKEQSETDSDTQFKSVASLPSRRGSRVQKCDESSCFESDGNEAEQNNIEPLANTNEPLVSASEWIGVTTNSEGCSYSSESIDTDSENELNNNDQTIWENDFGPTTILSPRCAPSDLVSCTIWEKNDLKKADLSVLDISSAIIGRVESMPDSLDYFYFGFLFSLVLAVVPIIIRISDYVESIVQGEEQLSVMNMSFLIVGKLSSSVIVLINIVLSSSSWQRFVMAIALVERFFLSSIFFFQLAVAERTFKQRFLYAKLFSHLTSSRKARKSDLPHFRLNKVRNIKTWLSVRSYLKKRGPQRSVDVIVSAAFIITLLLLSFVSIELVKNSAELNSQYSAEALFWALCLGLYLLRFMTLGTKINSKYRNLSVLMTEQINLYLQIEQKPHKKDELMVANSVLKLATDLLKELESPFKISGLSANPYLYTITKLVILSALSGVLSEMLGFKLKLHKLSIK